MAELSDKQRLFCREVAKGTAPRLAYIMAFDCKESTAAANACRMLKRANIQAEISRLKDKGAAQVAEAREAGREIRALWGRAEKMERLQSVFELSVSEGRFGDAISAIRELNKMDGDYRQAEQETNVQVNVGVSVADVVAAVMGVDH